MTIKIHHSEPLSEKVAGFNAYEGLNYALESNNNAYGVTIHKIVDSRGREVFRARGDEEAYAMLTVFIIGYGRGRNR